MNIGIFYGSTTGATKRIAHQIGEQLAQQGTLSLFDVAQLTNPQLMHQFDLLLWGSPTWGNGDLQDDWDFILPRLDALDLCGKCVAIFGLGDQEGYGDKFVDAMGILHEHAIALGAEVIGYWPNTDYHYEASRAELQNGLFCGLALDEDNQGHLTDDRIARWCEQVLMEARERLC